MSFQHPRVSDDVFAGRRPLALRGQRNEGRHVSLHVLDRRWSAGSIASERNRPLPKAVTTRAS